MKPLRAISALVLVCAALQPAVAQDAPPTLLLSAAPSAVTIYPDQATVTRGGSIDLPAGDSLIVLPSVPAGLLRDSVTARGTAPAAVAIGAVEVRQASFDPRTGDARRAELTDRLREIDDEMATVDVRIAAQTAQLTLIERLSASFADQQRRPPATGEAPRLAFDPAAWRAAWETVRDGTAEAAEATRVLRQGRRTLEMRRTQIQAEINGLRSAPAGTLEITVALRAEAATRLDLSVSYQVPGARWQPVYEARLDSAAGRLTLRQEAIVTQRTGEDWRDVALTLSTARPTADSRPPELQPWRIRLVDPAELARLAEMARQQAADARPGGRTVMRGAVAPSTSAEAPAPAPPRDAETVAAVTASAGFAVEYRIPGRASLRSDGTDRRVRIGDLNADAGLSVRTIPRLDPRAFLVARFANPSETPTLAGQASLHLDGVFVGRVALPMLRPREETVLSFGADDRVRVSYALQAQRRGEEGGLLTGRTRSRSTEALITIRNFHQRRMDIVVADQLPVSGEEPLVVTLNADPAPTARDVDGRPGVLTWSATYAPGEERRIRFGYTVTLPRDREVTGLER
ncbi:mucoidy inhibitor MuiA family protein [Plastoroseomonas hellenica]|uniref:mucoidy inhibitor MuiA family protein n=1 Tax=Plastoroseomonas hellenica TaxID=2687306 RepID=UPI001BA52A78|nr:mucoidy inhibitor MuiA family protein [Plastoroseomonas hellenica]